MLRHCQACRRAAEATFRPHVHQRECHICAAAVSKHRGTLDNATGTANATTASVNGIPPLLSSVTLLPGRCDKSVGKVEDSALFSSFQLRRTALLEWLDRFSYLERKGCVSCEQAPSTEENVQDFADKAELEAAYETYLRCTDATVEEALFTRLVSSLEKQCQQYTLESPVLPTSPPAMEPMTTPAEDSKQRSSIRVPKHLVAFRAGVTATSTEPKAPVSPALGVNPSLHGVPNNFEVYVRQRFNGQAALVAKQLAFQEALLAVREVLASLKIRFFLACGTALGARRDGCFVPYDVDIDLGIFYEDIATPLSDADALPVSRVSSSSGAAAGLDTVQTRVYELLHTLASTRAFIVFDICGAVEKGLELRVLHRNTGTRIDINLYYPPILTNADVEKDEGSDDALVREKGLFLWAASFYELADKRKHGMYRYRHQPFATDLEELPFCSMVASSGNGFLVPPERYLVESYGEDWGIQKQFSYSEGLVGEFKNIIHE